MKILTGKNIKAADLYTIEHEPVSSLELMERASEVIAQWICNHIEREHPLLFFIGKGNNGGDGLAVARMLCNVGYGCSVYCAYPEEALSEECRIELERLPENIHRFAPGEEFGVDDQTVLIDALLGTGVGGEVKEPLRSLIEAINRLPNKVLSIDLPSGMKTEFGNAGQTIVQADATLTLEFPKLAMLLPETGEHCGEIEILPIELSPEFMNEVESEYHYITEDFIQSILEPRAKFAHKGTYGQALLVCGSRPMMGAAILSVGAALRSGCGLVTAHIPESERTAMQVSCPSAIVSLDAAGYFSAMPSDPKTYNAIGIGCGMGQRKETAEAFCELLYQRIPMVIDADALNILATHRKMLRHIPAGSILTPHPGELRRLVGEWNDEQHKIGLVKELAAQTRAVVVVKGAHTMVVLPDGCCFFNSTGCSGMAKGGSGDVLTGYLTGLIARGYAAPQAALLGVYIHGLAGEKAAEYYGEEGMNSSDLVDFLAESQRQLE